MSFHDLFIHLQLVDMPFKMILIQTDNKSFLNQQNHTMASEYVSLHTTAV